MEPVIWFLVVGVSSLAGGVLAIGGAVLNLDAFFESPKAQPIVQSLGRTGARVFYIFLGIAFGAIGAFLTWRGVQLMQQAA